MRSPQYLYNLKPGFLYCSTRNRPVPYPQLNHSESLFGDLKIASRNTTFFRPHQRFSQAHRIAINIPPDPSTWVNLYGDYLFRFAMARVRNRTVAEDLVQDTLLAALNAVKNFEKKSSFPTWLVGILKNKVMDHFRRVGRFKENDSAEVELDSFFLSEGEWRDHWDPEKGPKEWTVDTSDIVERREFMAILQDCLKGLSDRLAAAFSMREIDGMETDEICKVLEVSPTNLWVMLHRGRMQLRRCLEHKWLERK